MREPPKEMREKILAAARLFADHGLDATKMEDIAAATGVPKATLYYYFKSKEDILAFLFNEILDKVEHAIRTGLQTNGSSVDRLRAAIVEHLRVFELYPAASRALQFDLGRAARLPTINERINAAFLKPIRGLLDAGAKEGSLRSFPRPDLVSVAILGTITTVGINTIAVDQTTSVDDIANDVANFILQGVSACQAQS